MTVLVGGWITPQFVGVSTLETAGTVTGNVLIPTPSQVLAGDYMVMFLVCNKDTVTPAAGWNQIDNQLGGNPWQTIVYDRVATSADVGGTNYTWNMSNTTAAPDFAIVVAYRYVDDTLSSIASSVTTTANPVTGPSTTSTTPSLAIYVRTYRQSSATEITSTASPTERVDSGNHSLVAYSGALYEAAAWDTTPGTVAGISVTASAAPTDSASFTMQLAATHLSRRQPRMGMTQSVIKAANW